METSTIPQLLDDTKLVEDTTQPPPETTAVTQPLPDVVSWMQPFVDCEDGLVDMEANLNHDLEKDLLEYFSKCFKKVFIQVEKDAEGNILETLKYTDKIGFYDTFKKYQALLDKGNPNSTESRIALEQVRTKLLRCLKEVYFVGTFDVPALVFCGMVDVHSMRKGNAFHGYNERTLAENEAQKLKCDMQEKYLSIGGIETIFLMCKAPMVEMVEQYSPNSAPQKTLSMVEKAALIKALIKRQFKNEGHVPNLMIPACGKFVVKL